MWSHVCCNKLSNIKVGLVRDINVQLVIEKEMEGSGILQAAGVSKMKFQAFP